MRGGWSVRSISIERIKKTGLWCCARWMSSTAPQETRHEDWKWQHHTVGMQPPQLREGDGKNKDQCSRTQITRWTRPTANLRRTQQDNKNKTKHEAKSTQKWFQNNTVCSRSPELVSGCCCSLCPHATWQSLCCISAAKAGCNTADRSVLALPGWCIIKYVFGCKYMKENDYLVNDTVLLHTVSMFRLHIWHFYEHCDQMNVKLIVSLQVFYLATVKTSREYNKKAGLYPPGRDAPVLIRFKYLI